MAETFLSPVIKKLVDLLIEEGKSLKGVHREVDSLKDELEIIQSFLRDVDVRSARGNTGETMKTWMKQVRDEADRIEDVVDEYRSFVGERCNRFRFISFLRKVGRMFRTLKQRHDIASEIRSSNKSLCKIKDRAERFGLQPLEQGSSSGTKNVQAYDPRISSHFVEKDELVGIESTSKELVKWLVEGPSRGLVIALVGEGGIGKTTLAKTIYDNTTIKGHFDGRAWITVSQSYDIEKVLKAIKDQLCPTVEQPAGDLCPIKELVCLLRNNLETKRYVIVFDDVWQPDFWEVIKLALPSNNTGNRIVVTTRNFTVVNSLKETRSVIVQELKQLSPELAWELFCKKAFGFEFKGHCPQELEQLSREIVNKCQGLPLVIAAVGGLLSTKEKVGCEWKKVLDSLTNEIRTNPQLTNVFKILSFSYYDLPFHLRSCFLCFGIFPEDYEIHANNLSDLWFAESFVELRRDKTMEQVAEDYLNELMHRNLVSCGVDHWGYTYYRVHDLIRDIILTKADESRFFQFLNIEDESRCKQKSRRLSIHNTAKDVLEIVGNSRIRSISLFNIGELDKSFLPSLLKTFKLLKVLNLRNTPLDFLPKEVGYLIHLKCLNLRGTNVKKLPKSIGKLLNLQRLDVYDTLVHELPVEINTLRSLRWLFAFCRKDDGDLEGVRINEGFGCLEELQYLGFVKAYPARVGFMKELGRLKKLKTLGITELNKEIANALGASIQKLNSLKDLHLLFANDENLDLKCIISSPPPPIRTLRLRCPLLHLPAWISDLQNLHTLSLFKSRLMDEPLKCIGGLPNLAHLDMWETYDGEELHFEAGRFQKLKQLKLRDLKGLKVINIEVGALPLLEELEFGPFPLVMEMPSCIQNLQNLKTLDIIGMPREFVAGLQPDGGSDCWKIQHLPSVQFCYKCKGASYFRYNLGSSELLQHLQKQAA